MGITIALDDFGTGYSSLSYLNKFSFDILKIDRSFIKNLDQEKNNHIILNTIINLAKSLNIKTVGEGIENEKQYRHLNEIKCVNAQGYFMSKPVDGEQLLKLLNEKTNYRNLLTENF
jgi:EAL domain-containing protein (putative c-di-GMP-specific phosphodiesterase class I)